MDEPTPTARDFRRDARAWAQFIAASLRAAREAAGLSQRAAAARFGKVVLQLERCASVNVRLDQVWELATGYQADPVALITEGAVKPLTGRTLEQVDDAVRAALRERRIAVGIGTPALAEVAGVHHSWIIRVESGEYRRLDLLRLWALAQALDATLADWLSPRRTPEAT